MPCATICRSYDNVLHGGLVEASDLIYDSVIPGSEDEKSKIVQVKESPIYTAAENGQETVVAPSLQRRLVEREVPYYAEEEAEPALDATRSVIPPDLETVVYEFFPYTFILPPPPPGVQQSLEKVQYWYQRLVNYPHYRLCCEMAEAECPEQPRVEGKAEGVAAATQWVLECKQWWTELSKALPVGCSACRIPTKRSWNPYGTTSAVVYSAASTKVVYPNAEVLAMPTNYLPPPPPPYMTLVEEYTRLFTRNEAETIYLRCLTQWWRSACQWSAAMRMKVSWICPPPSTGIDAWDWASRCCSWWNFSTEQLKEHEKRVAATLMMSNICMQTVAPPMNGSAVYQDAKMLW